ncbi:MAG: DivIVA domain-containing protein, partial [Oscillospiraceae bacterium]|nr:DivIVA domain-containing protein [Oscillospiraceae bacterium]
MLIPEELRDITFDKSAFGYRVDDVDDYVDKVTAVINALMEENQDLEEKLEVLAAKVAEYKEDESSLQAAIVGAQKLGDSIVRDSKIKAESILREADVRAERLV